MKMYLPPRGDRSSRRGFLQKGLIGGALLALGGGSWLFTRKGSGIPVPEGVTFLNAQEYAVVWALVQRFVPVRENFPSVEALQIGVACDRVIGMMEETTRAELKQLLMLFENALPNFLFGGRTVPFTQLNPTEQDQVLEEWRDSRITLRRTGHTALRGLVMAAYYAQKAVWPAVGYPGPLAGIHDPNAPLWKGGDARPVGNGTFVEPPPAPEADAGVTVDGGVP